MNILLLGRDDSITATIEQMLCSVTDWRIYRSNGMNKEKWQKVKEVHKQTPFSVITANLEGFAQPPHVHTRQIVHALPSVPLLVLHSYQKEIFIKPILDAGATGYVYNNVSEKKLLEAVSKIQANQKIVFTQST